MSTYNYHYFGAIPCLATPKEDYADFQHVVMDRLSLRASLAMGNLPPGMLIANDSVVHQVFGEYGKPQHLKRMGRRG